MKKIVFLSGLPRSGSTLLCNLLAMHPDIKATPSSPLCTIVSNMRRQWSDDSFLLAQLDTDFDNVYSKLIRSTRAFIETWSDQAGKKICIDKNRGWLFHCETLRHLYPDFKMIVTIRDPRDIFASIERRHRETLLLEFGDHLEHNIIQNRAQALFANNGVVGNPLRAINNLEDIPGDIRKHLYFWRYEDFARDPKSVNDNLFKWLGVESVDLDLNNIPQITQEADSFYRMKYPHTIKSKFEPAKTAAESNISPRVLNGITQGFLWFYQQYYPNLINQQSNENKSTYNNHKNKLL